MRHHRVPVPRVFPALVILGLLVTAPAFPAGFQVMTQGARATGMGLAFAGVADDPTAVFYNPAGMAFQDHFGVVFGGSVLGREKDNFVGADPFPGVGSNGTVEKQEFVLPHLYIVAPLTQELSAGFAVDEPYGLGLRWNNVNTWSGRFVSQNAVIKTMDLNAAFSYKLFPQLSVAAGVVYRFSGLQLERNQDAVDPFTGSIVDVAHAKLYSGLTSNGDWGWNVALMWKPTPGLGIGGSYRSKITVDYTGTITLTPRSTGNPVLDGLVALQIPFGNHPVQSSISFPASVNAGFGLDLGSGFKLAGEADWTEWSSFAALNIVFPDNVAPDVHRPTLWTDSWTFRGGLEKTFTSGWALRAGYYFDNTPQPTRDAGPILADNDRNVVTAGFGYNTPQFGFDFGAAYIMVKKLSVLTESTDNFFGTYSENAWAAVLDFRISF